MYFPSVGAFTALAILLSVFFWIIGLPLSSLLSKRSNHFFALPVGFALFSCVGILFSLIFNVGVTQSIAIAVACVIISFLCGVRKFEFVRFRISVRQIVILTLCLILSFVVSSTVYLKMNGNEFLYSAPIFDHMKIAIINSIKRNGLPIINPFMLTSPNNEEIHYYYLWFLSAANISLLTNISGWAADIVLTFITALTSLFVVCGLIKENSSGKLSTYVIGISALFGSQLVTYIDRITQGQIFEYIPREHPFESWIIQASWVPQHLMAASVVITSCYFMFSINKNHRWISSLVISMLISTGVGSSTWVGGVTFAVISIFLFIFNLIANKSEWKFILSKWAFIACMAVIISLPLLINQISAAKPTGVFPIGIHSYNASPSGNSLSNILTFLILFVPLYLPTVALGLVLACIPRKSLNCSQTVILFIIAICSILTSMLLKSQIANNDLGWRAIIPAVLVSSSLIAISIERLKREAITCISIIVIAISIPSAIEFSKNLLQGNFRNDNVGIVSTFLDITNNTESTDRLLINPRKFEGRDVLDGNVLPSIIIDRNSCFTNLSYAYAFSNQWGESIGYYWNALKEFYAGHATDEDLAKMKKLKCTKLVVLPGDGIWNKFPYKNSEWVLTIDKTDFKIYSQKH
ncbi:Uncharacterised protein [Escherichia coli]|nr:hypothetical protein [Escherichia coli]SQY55139.1 Uncharacterised protein [Escherichia coli]SQY97589.1 Uncharacterised protein [Escherichia coli]